MTEDRTETAGRSRSELYDEFEVPWAGRVFAKYLLPVLDLALDVDDEYDTQVQTEVMAEIALWRAFSEEPKFKPYLLLVGMAAVFDYLYQLPVEVYGIAVVGLATLGGIMTNIRSRRLLAAEYSELENEKGVPASLRLSAINAASSSITLVFVGIGIILQLVISIGVLGNELLKQNILVNSGFPPLGIVIILTVALIVRGYSRL